jgi:hypothetical protein
MGEVRRGPGVNRSDVDDDANLYSLGRRVAAAAAAAAAAVDVVVFVGGGALVRASGRVGFALKPLDEGARATPARRCRQAPPPPLQSRRERNAPATYAHLFRGQSVV